MRYVKKKKQWNDDHGGFMNEIVGLFDQCQKSRKSFKNLIKTAV